ncbi:hypothetical protein QE429_000643 [Bacillus sp. SORGH_AS 510]|nr:hypothetical protein [Bacillus sp. SORGH_AS_0510]
MRRVGRHSFYDIFDRNSPIDEFMLVLTKRLISIAYRENSQNVVKKTFLLVEKPGESSLWLK